MGSGQGAVCELNETGAGAFATESASAGDVSNLFRSDFRNTYSPLNVTHIVILFPIFMILYNKSLKVLPRISSRRVKFQIRRICGHYCRVIVLTQSLHIVR